MLLNKFKLNKRVQYHETIKILGCKNCVKQKIHGMVFNNYHSSFPGGTDCCACDAVCS